MERLTGARFAALGDGVAFDIDDVESDPAAREAELARLRREDPVHRDAKSGFWLLTRHADVREASKQPELFSSASRSWASAPPRCARAPRATLLRIACALTIHTEPISRPSENIAQSRSVGLAG